MREDHNNNAYIFSGTDISHNGDLAAAQRATSPAGSGIPTPGGRSLAPRSQSATPDKPQNRIPSASTPTPTSQKSNIPASKQNSMLDKLKLFNTKDKAKTKTGSIKGPSKAGSTGSTSTSTLSTSSRSDTSSSLSARSSSSADAGPSSSATSTNDPDSPKLSKPRPIVGGVISAKQDNVGGLTIGHQQSRQSSPSPYSSSLPATPTSSLPVSHSKKTSSKKSGEKNTDAQQKSQLPSGQISSKGGKGGSFIPKSGSKSQKPGTATPVTPSSGSQIPSHNSVSSPASSTPGAGISGTAANSSIPKPQSSSKLTKQGKEEKLNVSTKDHGSVAGSIQPSTNPHMNSLTKKSKSHSSQQHQQQIQQQQHQQQQLMYSKSNSQNPSQGQSSSSPAAPPVPPHRNGSQLTGNGNSLPRQQSQPNKQSGSQGRAQNDSSTLSKNRYTEIEYTDGRIDRVGEGHVAKPPVQSAPNPQSSEVRGHHKEFSHSYMITSQSVNVVKPTCSTPQSPVLKSDGNAQTSVSIIHNRSAQPPPLPKTDPPPSTRTTIHHANQQSSSAKSSPAVSGSTSSTHSSSTASTASSQSSPNQSPVKKDNSANKSEETSDTSHSASSSSTDSVILTSSAVNSPRLGVKVLGSQTNRPANNVAIVQPHHGEKKETTFDAEIRTDVINKGDKSSPKKDLKNPKETTFSEKKTTFVADSGETLDIQPMQPINRSMHYAQGFMRGYASPGKPLPISVSQNQCYTMTGISPNRMGINRSLLEANRFYSGPIKRAISSGSGSVSFDEYNSDYDPYDYISGYMSDGDILKGNKMDDMSSGYMSEGGASLYARRLQQRFREGMQAVKECMQKNTGGEEDR